MSGLVGKNTLSLKKLNVAESNVPALGFSKVRFLHEASLGDTTIDLTNLNAPSNTPTYSAPSVTELTSANIKQFKDNVTLTSSKSGRLMQDVSYVITNATNILLLFEADEGEIFEGIIDHVAKTVISLADATPLSVTGELAINATDFNVGTPFKVSQFLPSQHGAIMVFDDGQIAFRNTNNQPPGAGVDGDYQEINAGGGLGTIIRFNTPDLVKVRNISVVSIGSLVERPIASQLALVEALQGQVDLMVPTLAGLAGVPETDFQGGGPNNVDLKAFGDRVFVNEDDIEGLSEPGDLGSPLLAGTTVAGASKKSRFQEKVLSATVSTDVVATDLTWNGLVIGRTYRLGGQFSISIGADDQVDVIIDNGATRIGRIVYEGSGGGASGNTRYGINILFVATATTVTYTVAGTGSGSNLNGNGTKDQTFAQIEELDDTESTTAFS